LGSGDDLDFHAHEVDGQVSAVELGKADRILLRSDKHVCAALLASVHGIQDLLLGESVMIGVASR
jgi:hypothetical protein